MNRPFTVTIFGAESVGKTTLARQLAEALGGEWVHEFARDYLETTGQDVTPSSMRAIWQGQAGLQRQARVQRSRYVIQDTDLFSTIGYWCLPHVEPRLGPCPTSLVRDARALRSDLYLILRSNIPFAADRLRYGGDRRESPDQYWIDLCRHYALPYLVIDASDQSERLSEAQQLIYERSHLCVA